MARKDLTHRTTRQEYALLVLILMLGAVFRILNLNTGFFGDELHTIRVALCYPLSYIISNNWGSFFYQVLVHFLLPLGAHELAARIPAVIFGVLGIYALFLLTRRLFGTKEALFAAAYLAVLPFHIYWSQTARGYSAFLLFSLLALLYFLKSITDNRPSAWVGFIVFSVMAAYTHLFYLSCLASHAAFEGILLLLGLRGRKRLWTVNKKHITGLVLSLMVIGTIIFVLYYPDLTRGSGIERITLHSKFSKQTRPIDTNIGLFFQLTHKTFIWMTQSWNPNFILSALLMLFFIIGVMDSLRKEKSQLILILLSLTLPVAIFLYGGPSDSTVRNAPDRYLTYLLPFFLILISKGVIASWYSLVKMSSRLTQANQRFERHFIKTGIVTTFIIFCIFFLPQILRVYDYRKSQPDFKGALQHINTNMDADSILVLEGTFLFFFEDSNIRDGLPVYIDRFYENRYPLLSKYDIVQYLNKFPHQKKQVWGIVYLPEEEPLSGTYSGSANSFHKLAVVRYERDTLQSNFTRLFSDLLDLRENNREDYLLILALLKLHQNDIEKTRKALQSLGKFHAYDIPGQEDLKPGWASHTLSKRQQMYNQLSHELFVRGEYEGSVFSFLRFSKRLLTGGRIDEAVNSLEKYLTNKLSKKERNRLVDQFMEPIPFDDGIFFLWKDPDGWHVRWRARKNIELTVRVESSSKIRSVQKTRLENEGGFQRKPRSVTYETRAQASQIDGFDFQVKGKPKLTFKLSLNQREFRKVIFGRKEKPTPEKIPEDLKVYTGKSGRAILCIDLP